MNNRPAAQGNFFFCFYDLFNVHVNTTIVYTNIPIHFLISQPNSSQIFVNKSFIANNLFLNSNLNNFLMADLSQEEWVEQMKSDENAVILDVRTLEEVEDGYIANSTNIDIYLGQGFIDEVEKLDKDKNYYVYCRSGNRSGQACAIMNSLGFENTFNLEGGFMNWEGEVVE